MRISLLLIFCQLMILTEAQITVIIDSVPPTTPEGDTIYIAGDFQGWDPGHPEYVLDQLETGVYTITLDSLEEGQTYNYKFTRGSWETVEKGANGDEIENRTFLFGRDVVKNHTIQRWSSLETTVKSTATWNVSFVDEEFYIPQFDRYRRIWIYLPPGYDSTQQAYPVIYMHDGQNLFDNKSSYGGEWQVDETLNRLFSLGYRVPIVVGIENGGIKRIDELTPWINPEYGGGQGDEYLAFIAKTLKPFIDRTYRTIPDPSATGLAGSSLGGLISFYGALKHPNTFGRCGALSPAYWFVLDSMISFIDTLQISSNVRIYQNSGSMEGEKNIQFLRLIEDKITQQTPYSITTTLIEGGQHDEQTWRSDFDQAYLYLFGRYANKIKRKELILPLILEFNPDDKTLALKNTALQADDSIRITKESGPKVDPGSYQWEGTLISFTKIDPGIYQLEFTREKIRFIGRFQVK